MSEVDGNLPEDSGSILTSQNLPQHQEGKVDPGDLIRAVLADKSAFNMLYMVYRGQTGFSSASINFYVKPMVKSEPTAIK